MKNLLDDPLVQTSSGLLVANITHLSPAKNPTEALDAALRTGRRVLIAVQLTPEEAEEVRAKLDEAAAVAVTGIGIYARDFG